jgi:diguanylate cyclase (GGDEF)-like protein
MILDRDTTFAVSALVTLLMGVVALIVQGKGRMNAWATCWGLGNVAFGLSNINKVLIGVVPDAWRVAGENVACLTGYCLIVQGARLLAGRRPHWKVWATALIVMAVPLGAAHAPLFKPDRLAFNNLVFIIGDLWVAFEAATIARKERLDTPWVMVGLFAATAPLACSRLFITILSMLHLDTLDHVRSGPWTTAVLAAIWSLRVALPALVVAERGHRALERLACRDQLTGALNRVGLDRLLGNLTGTLAVLMLDLDNFKPLNDRHGHAKGDDVLKLLAATIDAQLKSEDALVRLGGDEFLVILPQATAQEARRIADKIRAAFADAVAAADLAEPPTTISMGIATGHVDRSDLAGLLRDADTALYRAKNHGRDRVAA